MTCSNLRRGVALSVVALAAFIALAAVAGAQAQPPAPAGTAAPAAGDAGVQKMIEGDEGSMSGAAYTYDPAGRRDPFKSLLVGAPKAQGTGLQGILVDELKLQGIWRVRSGLLAQMIGPSNQVWLLKKGDQLADGEVLNITTNEIVFRQNVNDPTMLKPFREVVRELNPTTPK